MAAPAFVLPERPFQWWPGREGVRVVWKVKEEGSPILGLHATGPALPWGLQGWWACGVCRRRWQDRSAAPAERHRPYCSFARWVRWRTPLCELEYCDEGAERVYRCRLCRRSLPGVEVALAAPRGPEARRLAAHRCGAPLPKKVAPPDPRQVELFDGDG